VETIAQTIPATTALVDEAFSPTATIPLMDDHTVVHLATHAAFVSGQPEESFIVFRQW
jgi:CHAT domain-containing protein